MKKESKFQNNALLVIIIFVILYFVNYIFSKEQIIFGLNYYVIIWILPIIFGLIILFIIRKKFLQENLKNPGIGIWYLIQGIIFSHLTIGLISLFLFEQINSQFIENKKVEVVNCSINELVSFDNNRFSIDFNLRNESKRISISQKTYFNFKKKDLNKYMLKFEFKDGLLGTVTKINSKLIRKMNI
ncbi:hypothetical protein H9W90_10000 [Polaribacter pectinis]|uniref:Uncharacterized protein n=1 Tax=Polaribacter pectinis TaxID=2738844 RepID=A0A7G9L7C9_9FLAO|nr:hypothetical protein [Polaribacter pectinis]QNM84528.1 hypothetical protein H9W90_10000 [Polaribacter pectinis]